MYHLSPCIVALLNKRVQSDAAAAADARGVVLKLSMKGLLYEAPHDTIHTQCNITIIT